MFGLDESVSSAYDVHQLSPSVSILSQNSIRYLPIKHTVFKHLIVIADNGCKRYENTVGPWTFKSFSYGVSCQFDLRKCYCYLNNTISLQWQWDKTVAWAMWPIIKSWSLLNFYYMTFHFDLTIFMSLYEFDFPNFFFCQTRPPKIISGRNLKSSNSAYKRNKNVFRSGYQKQSYLKYIVDLEILAHLYFS